MQHQTNEQLIAEVFALIWSTRTILQWCAIQKYIYIKYCRVFLFSHSPAQFFSIVLMLDSITRLIMPLLSHFFLLFLSHLLLTRQCSGRLDSYTSFRFSPAEGLVSVNPSATAPSIATLLLLTQHTYIGLKWWMLNAVMVPTNIL